MNTLQYISLPAGIALMATAVFTASCSNDIAEPQLTSANTPKPIEFRVQGGIKKLMPTTSSDMASFVVTAMDDQSQYDGEYYNTLLNAQVVYKRRDIDPYYGEIYSDTWHYSPDAYYNVGATEAHFYAYSPVSNNVIDGIGGNFVRFGDNVFTYEVPTLDAGLELSQEDLLLAYTHEQQLGGPVFLEFRHALSRVFVSAINNTDDGIVINDIQLLNLNSRGTIHYRYDESWDHDDRFEAMQWEYQSGMTHYSYLLPESGVFLKGNSGSTPKLLTTIEQGMMVMPQRVESYDGVVYKKWFDGIGYGNTWVDKDNFEAPDNGYYFLLAIDFTLANTRSIVYIPAPNNDFTFQPNRQYNLIATFDPSVSGVDGGFPVKITFAPYVNGFEAPLEVELLTP